MTAEFSHCNEDEADLTFLVFLSSAELLETGLSFYLSIFLIMIFYTLALCFM